MLEEIESNELVSAEKTVIFQTQLRVVLELFGEYAPFEKYLVDSEQVTIGRDKTKCQIFLADPDVSSTHAKFIKQNNVCYIEDLKSSNGTLLNGARISKAQVASGDEIVIGTTTLTVVISSSLLDEEQGRLMPVDENQVVEVEEIVESETDFAEDGTIDNLNKSKALFSKDALKDPKKRVKLLLIAAGLMAAFLFFGEEGQNPAEKNKKNTKKKEQVEIIKVDEVDPFQKLSDEDKQYVEAQYQLAFERGNAGNYREALTAIEAMKMHVPTYKKSPDLEREIQNGIKQLEELEEKKKKEERERIKREKVKQLLEKATAAVKERNVTLANSMLQRIKELDPNNYDVSDLEVELDAWVKEQDRIKLEKSQKEAERKRMEDSLAPGTNAFNKKEWFVAIMKLELFLKQENIDEDLLKKGAEMLTTARIELKKSLDPELEQARALRDGDDLKGAYQHYLVATGIDPTNEEAMTEINKIKEELTNRARKVYREAIIIESLTLFEEAKEKLEEVRQIAPSDNKYYKLATEKLKDYLEYSK